MVICLDLVIGHFFSLFLRNGVGDKFAHTAEAFKESGGFPEVLNINNTQL